MPRAVLSRVVVESPTRNAHGFLDVPDLAERLEACREFVYCVWAVGGRYVKIGRSSHHPKQRMDTLATGNPAALVLAAYSITMSEKRAHRKLRKSRARNEWFSCTPEVLQEISGWEWINHKVIAKMWEVAHARN